MFYSLVTVTCFTIWRIRISQPPLRPRVPEYSLCSTEAWRRHLLAPCQSPSTGKRRLRGMPRRWEDSVMTFGFCVHFRTYVMSPSAWAAVREGHPGTCHHCLRNWLRPSGPRFSSPPRPLSSITATTAAWHQSVAPGASPSPPASGVMIREVHPDKRIQYPLERGGPCLLGRPREAGGRGCSSVGLTPQSSGYLGWNDINRS